MLDVWCARRRILDADSAALIEAVPPATPTSPRRVPPRAVRGAGGAPARRGRTRGSSAETVSDAELNARANRLAHQLRTLGVGRTSSSWAGTRCSPRAWSRASGDVFAVEPPP